jgi:hypothetical protein
VSAPRAAAAASAAASPRVPSFLNSPVLPSRASTRASTPSLTRDLLGHSRSRLNRDQSLDRFGPSTSWQGQGRDRHHSLFESDNLGQRSDTLSTFNPNPRKKTTRHDSSWRRDARAESQTQESTF